MTTQREDGEPRETELPIRNGEVPRPRPPSPNPPEVSPGPPEVFGSQGKRRLSAQLEELKKEIARQRRSARIYETVLVLLTPLAIGIGAYKFVAEASSESAMSAVLIAWAVGTAGASAALWYERAQISRRRAALTTFYFRTLVILTLFEHSDSASSPDIVAEEALTLLAHTSL